MKRLLLAAAFGAAGCAAWTRPRRAPAPKPAPLSAESRKELSKRYYEAVDAYMRGDYERSRALIGSILAADPGNADALALRRRVLAVEKASAP